jgi:hypothetical protein
MTIFIRYGYKKEVVILVKYQTDAGDSIRVEEVQEVCEALKY